MGKDIYRRIAAYVGAAAAVLLGTVFLYTYILVSAVIPSESMENTMMTGDRIIGSRLAYKLGKDPERLDIVIFYAPDLEKTPYIKRIIGLPGDCVEIKGGKVYVNGEELEEPYIREEMDEEEDMEFHVPEGQYFMLGDNRNVSLDSRYWEDPFVEKEEIIAKAIFKYWKGISKL
ncbi:MAG: signal peptidase I [Eubacteriales bacterium]|nr:signal peptidase I [Eubacteriales bacterium]